jgi:hypothetical protein
LRSHKKRKSGPRKQDQYPENDTTDDLAGNASNPAGLILKRLVNSTIVTSDAAGLVFAVLQGVVDAGS